MKIFPKGGDMPEETIVWEVDNEGYVNYFKVTTVPETACILCKVKLGILKVFGKNKILCLRTKLKERK